MAKAQQDADVATAAKKQVRKEISEEPVATKPEAPQQHVPAVVASTAPNGVPR